MRKYSGCGSKARSRRQSLEGAWGGRRALVVTHRARFVDPDRTLACCLSKDLRQNQATDPNVTCLYRQSLPTWDKSCFRKERDDGTPSPNSSQSSLPSSVCQRPYLFWWTAHHNQRQQATKAELDVSTVGGQGQHRRALSPSSCSISIKRSSSAWRPAARCQLPRSAR